VTRLDLNRRTAEHDGAEIDPLAFALDTEENRLALASRERAMQRNCTFT
jgi:hypothetical protein